MRFYKSFNRARFARAYMLWTAGFLFFCSLVCLVAGSHHPALQLLEDGGLLSFMALVDLLNFTSTLAGCGYVTDWGTVRMHYFLGLTASFVRWVYENSERVEREVKHMLRQPQYLAVKTDLCHDMKTGNLVNAAAFLYFTRELEHVRYGKRGGPDKLKRTAARIEKGLRTLDRTTPAPKPPKPIDHHLEIRDAELERLESFAEDIEPEEDRRAIQIRVAELVLMKHRNHRDFMMKAHEIDRAIKALVPAPVAIPVGLRRPRPVSQT